MRRLRCHLHGCVAVEAEDLLQELIGDVQDEAERRAQEGVSGKRLGVEAALVAGVVVERLAGQVAGRAAERARAYGVNLQAST